MSQATVATDYQFKTNTAWSIACEFIDHNIIAGAWVTKQKQLTGFELYSDVISDKTGILNLYHCEKRDYRNNLKTDHPRLYVVLDNSSSQQDKLLMITASPQVAKRYADQEYLVLSKDMPAEVQHWIRDYLN